MDEQRLVVPEHLREDGEEIVIRPRSFQDYIGQDQTKENIGIFQRKSS